MTFNRKKLKCKKVETLIKKNKIRSIIRIQNSYSRQLNYKLYEPFLNLTLN